MYGVLFHCFGRVFYSEKSRKNFQWKFYTFFEKNRMMSTQINTQNRKFYRKQHILFVVIITFVIIFRVLGIKFKVRRSYYWVKSLIAAGGHKNIMTCFRKMITATLTSVMARCACSWNQLVQSFVSVCIAMRKYFHSNNRSQGSKFEYLHSLRMPTFFFFVSSPQFVLTFFQRNTILLI